MDPAAFELAKTAIETGCATIAFTTASVSLAVYRYKMARLKVQEKGTARLEEQVTALQDEVAQLRDTATSYDMSFDSALQRMEARVHHLETRDRRTPAAEHGAEQPATLAGRQE